MFQEQLDKLNSEEKATFKDAIAHITLLVAGADGKIDDDELAWGEKITKIRGYANPGELSEYYDMVGSDFTDRLSQIHANLPSDNANEHLSNELAKLNGILAKLDVNFAAPYYKSLLSFANHVAKSSGGLLGFGSVSKAEKEVIGLSMITPIVLEEE